MYSSAMPINLARDTHAKLLWAKPKIIRNQSLTILIRSFPWPKMPSEYLLLRHANQPHQGYPKLLWVKA